MDLQKLAGDTVDGIIATLKFLRAYGRDSIWLLFRPSFFVRQFTGSRDNRQRDSYLFLFTTVLVLETSLSVCNRVLDASKSTDVGAGVLLYSGVIWELSWQALLKGTIPLYIALIAIGWVLAYSCGADSEDRASFRDVYPYCLLRGTVLIVFSLGELTAPPASDWPFSGSPTSHPKRLKAVCSELNDCYALLITAITRFGFVRSLFPSGPPSPRV